MVENKNQLCNKCIALDVCYIIDALAYQNSKVLQKVLETYVLNKIEKKLYKNIDEK